MSAEVLRRATRDLRIDAGAMEGSDHEFLHAVADWLQTAGADLWAHGPLCACEDGCNDCDDLLWAPHVRRALAVARAYLGEQP